MKRTILLKHLKILLDLKIMLNHQNNSENSNMMSNAKNFDILAVSLNT